MTTGTLADRLRLALAEIQQTAPHKTKSGLARYVGVRSPSVTDWFNGRTKSIEYRNLLKAAAFLGVSAEWLRTGEGEMHSPSVSVIEEFDSDEKRDDEVSIAEYRITFACGDNVSEPVFEEIKEAHKASYRRSWFQKKGINPDNCKRFKVRGNSMEALICDRDTILVDCSEKDIIPGKIYAFSIHGTMRVKFLQPMLDGSIIVKSYNPDFPDEVLKPCDLSTFNLIGRVRDRSGDSFF